MSAALRKPMTQDEFFDWAQARDGKYWFDGFEPVAMVGGTNRHGILSRNIVVELSNRLRGRQCSAHNSDGGGVQTIGNRIRYPEATVTCSRVPPTGRLIPDPVIIVEVLSDSTRSIDQVNRLREYHAVPTIRRYILVEQSGIAVTVHARDGDEPWRTTVHGEGETLALPEIGTELPLAAIYESIIVGD